MKPGGFPARAHSWRQVGKLSAEVMGRVCDCGCGQQSIVILTKDGGRHEIWNSGRRGSSLVPNDAFGKAAAAVELGRELVGLFERIRKVVA